jgi:hypothetical protein
VEFSHPERFTTLRLLLSWDFLFLALRGWDSPDSWRWLLYFLTSIMFMMAKIEAGGNKYQRSAGRAMKAPVPAIVYIYRFGVFDRAL